MYVACTAGYGQYPLVTQKGNMSVCVCVHKILFYRYCISDKNYFKVNIKQASITCISFINI